MRPTSETLAAPTITAGTPAASVRELICARQLDVREAQLVMAEDWTDAYRKFVSEPTEPR